MKRHSILLPAALLLVLSACTKGTERAQGHSATEPKMETAAATHEGPHWSYEGETGPEHWGALGAECALCGSGKSQSPIDIDEPVGAGAAGTEATFAPASLEMSHEVHESGSINNGHTIQVSCADGDVLTIGGARYSLVQYHFHSPSEHTVKGRHYPMEMHLVHKAADGKLAVVGVLIEEGSHNAAFDPIWSHMPATKGAEAHLENVSVDVHRLLPADLKSYRYDGSLTTPPCSEGVKWILMATPIQMSAEQIAAFRDIIHVNNRPVQPLNGRMVVTEQVAENRK